MPNPSFKVTVIFEGNFRKNSVSYGQSFYRTVIWNHNQSAEWYQFRWPWV